MTRKLWEIADIAKLVEDARSLSKKREPYKMAIARSP
jgi:hypothetical protein